MVFPEEPKNLPKGKDKMEVYKYQSINEVPVPWRTHKSARLSLNQINEIVEDAHSHPIESEIELPNEDGTSIKASTEVPDYAGARKRFAEANHVENGFWLSGAETKETE